MFKLISGNKFNCAPINNLCSVSSKCARFKNIEQVKSERYVYDIILKDKPHCFTTVSGVVHNSELSTIDQKYPEKANEIKSGAFNTVATGQRITVESTAKGEIGVFGDLCQVGMDNKKKRIELTKLDWKFFFLSWHNHPQYQLKANIIIPREQQEYFDKLEAENKIKLTASQKNWYYKTKQTQGDKMLSEYPSTPEEAFKAVIEGAYFSKQMNKALEEKRICSVPYEPSLPVDTWWDLGTAKNRKDATSIIFTQDVGLEIHIIDFYGNAGEGFEHYIRILKEKEYIYGRHNAPHDIEVVELGTGKSRMEFAGSLGLHFDKVPNVGFTEGIENTRVMLRKCWFDEKKTSELVKALRAYRKEWDDKMGRWKDNPYKDWASDPCDAMRMSAVGHPDQIKLGDYDIEEEEMERIRENEESGQNVDPLNPFSL